MKIRALIVVTPKPGVSDPEGNTIKNAAGQLGFRGLAKVTAGKAFSVELDVENEGSARRMLEQLGDRLLANPVIQDFEIRELEVI